MKEHIEQVISGLVILSKYEVSDIGTSGGSIEARIERIVDSLTDYNKLKDLGWWQDEELTGELIWFWR